MGKFFKVNLKNSKGFTLIELLVVIAVIGILAAVVLIAVDPLEQFARARDTSRESAIAQLGRSLQNYFTSNGAQYPIQSTTAFTTLTTSSDIKAIPVNPVYSNTPTPNLTCAAANIQSTTSPVSNYCYLVNAGRTDAIVYARLESKSNNIRGGCANTMWFVFSTADGRGGYVCSASEPVVGNQTFTP